MLRPEYFDYIADVLIEIYGTLENYMLNDLAMRLFSAKDDVLSGTADRMAYKLNLMGTHKSEIIKQVASISKMSEEEVKRILQNAVMTSFTDETLFYEAIGKPLISPLDNPEVIRILDAEYQKTNGELSNLIKTTMNSSQQTLISALNEAEIRMSAGVESYSSAVWKILDNLAFKGMTVEYPTGAKRTVEAAVRNCIVTSANQTCAQMTNYHIKENGIEYVKVSQHLGARTAKPGAPYCADHSEWQGKIYKVDGSTDEYPNISITGYAIRDGVGVNEDLLGLHGYGCRHSHQPWDLRLKDNNEPINKADNEKKYKAQQKQRAIERKIRAYKRELEQLDTFMHLCGESDVISQIQAKYDETSYNLRETNAKYNDYCAENDLQKQYDRLKVAGWSRPQAQDATKGANRYLKNLK